MKSNVKEGLLPGIKTTKFTASAHSFLDAWNELKISKRKLRELEKDVLVQMKKNKRFEVKIGDLQLYITIVGGKERVKVRKV